MELVAHPSDLMVSDLDVIDTGCESEFISLENSVERPSSTLVIVMHNDIYDDTPFSGDVESDNYDEDRDLTASPLPEESR